MNDRRFFPNRLKKMEECQSPCEQQVQEQGKECTEDAHPPLYTDCQQTPHPYSPGAFERVMGQLQKLWH